LAELLSILFLGVVVGSIYSLSAFGLVLTYRTSGIFNFAHGAVGMFFAFTFFQLTQGGRVNLVFLVYDQTWHLPVPLGMILTVGVLAPAFGWGLNQVLFRHLRTASSVVKIVASIGLLIALSQGLAGVMWGGATTLTPRSIFPEKIFVFGGFRATLQEILTVLLALALAGGLLAFLRYSTLGVRMRAVVDRPDVSELMGVDSERVSGISWAIGSAFAALAGILVAPFFGSLNFLDLSLIVIVATAAAVVGRLESLPLTLAGGILIGFGQFLVQRYASSEVARQLFPSIPFLILFIVLMLPIRWPHRPEALAPPARFEPQRTQTQRQRSIRLGIIALVAVVPALLVGSEWQRNLSTVPPMALLFLSLVLLAGYAGQISLCQAAFAGFGAFVAAHLVSEQHWPFPFAALVAGLATVPLGALLASRATRLPPLFLGFATLAFTAVMDQVAFTSQSFSGGLVGIRFERSKIIASPRAYYFAGLLVFALFALLIRNLRNGKTGLALAAMRDTQVGLESTGASIVRLKFVAFCLSAFMAGIAGAMFSASYENATPYNYFTIISLLVLALAVIGGINRWSGALVGAALFQLFAPFLHQPFIQSNFVGREIFNGQLEQLLPIFFGLGAIGLAQNPGGIIEQTREGLAEFREKRAAKQAARDRAALPAEEAPPVAEPVLDGKRVWFPNARLYHRSSCVLTIGKDGKTLTAAVSRRLEPCPICAPGPIAVSRAAAARAGRGAGSRSPARSATRSRGGRKGARRSPK
jgi:branched-chain amino acid transport system permease protein